MFFNLTFVKLPLLHDFEALILRQSQLLVRLHHFREILVQLLVFRLSIYQLDAICEGLVDSLEFAVSILVFFEYTN